MTAPAAFQATFVDVQTIRTRSVVKLVMEVPVEQAGAALEALGGIPIPGKEPWVAIARLDLTKAKEPEKPTKPSVPLMSKPRSERAALISKRDSFRHWIGADEADASDGDFELKRRLGIASKTELDRDPEKGAAFDALVKEYDDWVWAQRLPEQRG